MSKAITWLLAVPVIGFTIWNIVDFILSETRSTTAYLAIGLNVVAIAEMVKLIRQEVRRNGGEK